MKPRPIKITPVLNGFVVEVGCQHVVFNDVLTLTRTISDYYLDPKKIEESYRANACHRALISEECPAPINRNAVPDGLQAPAGWGSTECAPQTDRPRNPLGLR